MDSLQERNNPFFFLFIGKRSYSCIAKELSYSLLSGWFNARARFMGFKIYACTGVLALVLFTQLFDLLEK